MEIQTISLMEDFPLPPNLVRMLIKLSDSNLPLSLSLSLLSASYDVCLLSVAVSNNPGNYTQFDTESIQGAAAAGKYQN